MLFSFSAPALSGLGLLGLGQSLRHGPQGGAATDRGGGQGGPAQPARGSGGSVTDERPGVPGGGRHRLLFGRAPSTVLRKFAAFAERTSLGVP